MNTRAHVACRGDQRIAVSFSIAAVKSPGVTLDDAGCVRKTFPEFHATLMALCHAWAE